MTHPYRGTSHQHDGRVNSRNRAVNFDFTHKVAKMYKINKTIQEQDMPLRQQMIVLLNNKLF